MTTSTDTPPESLFPPAQPSGARLLVVGCGGIGGIVSAHLLEQGHAVTVLTRNPTIRQAIETNGICVRGDAGTTAVKARAVESLADDEPPFDYVLLATQPPQVEDAARSVASVLSPNGRMVCFQNGLCEERVAAIVGRERVIGAIVAWGASMVEPGVYDRTSSGGFAVGSLDGSSDEPLAELARILEAIGPTSVTDNLPGARWSKLAINCGISSLGTIGGDRLGVLMRRRFMRRLCLEVMTEVVAVAKASGVKLEKVSGTLDLDWMALTDEDRVSAGSPSLFAKHALLLAVGTRYRRMRSSMLSAIERGRTPAVDFLNGEVVERGEKLGVPTPINEALRSMVWKIARGEATSGVSTVKAVFDATRAEI